MFIKRKKRQYVYILTITFRYSFYKLYLDLHGAGAREKKTTTRQGIEGKYSPEQLPITFTHELEADESSNEISSNRNSPANLTISSPGLFTLSINFGTSSKMFTRKACERCTEQCATSILIFWTTLNCVCISTYYRETCCESGMPMFMLWTRNVNVQNSLRIHTPLFPRRENPWEKLWNTKLLLSNYWYSMN